MLSLPLLVCVCMCMCLMRGGRCGDRVLSIVAISVMVTDQSEGLLTFSLMQGLGEFCVAVKEDVKTLV